MSQPLAIVSVINDLVSDQRVHRTALTLRQAGFNVLLVGRKRVGSLPLAPRDYATRRMKLLFEKGPIFYAEFNLRLFIFLLFHRSSLLVSNDLDTLLPNFIVSKFRKVTLVYDAHEYFTGVPELEKRPGIRRIWKQLERRMLPSIRHMITVNDSIAKLYEKEYGIRVMTVRNIPFAQIKHPENQSTRIELGLPIDRKIILLQGAGINIDRGAEEAIAAMQYLKGALLLIIGKGDVLPALKIMVKTLSLEEKVWFLPLQPPERLADYTAVADLGISLDKATNLNYRLSLPNKLFDYLQAGLPVVASPLPEVKKIIERFGCGVMIENHEPTHIAKVFSKILDDKMLYENLKAGARQAAKELSGEVELQPLQQLFSGFLNGAAKK